MNKLLEKINGSWIFLAVTILLYIIVAMIDFTLVEKALGEFITIFIKMIPIFILIFILMFLSNFYLNTKKISALLGEKAGIKGWLISVVGGIISSGPIYMWYPLLADLKEKKMRNAFIATFLYNRAVKIPMIPLMIFYFSLPFTIVLSIYMIIFSIINGVLVEKLLKVTYIKNI